MEVLASAPVILKSHATPIVLYAASHCIFMPEVVELKQRQRGFLFSCLTKQKHASRTYSPLDPQPSIRKEKQEKGTYLICHPLMKSLRWLAENQLLQLLMNNLYDQGSTGIELRSANIMALPDLHLEGTQESEELLLFMLLRMYVRRLGHSIL